MLILFYISPLIPAQMLGELSSQLRSHSISSPLCCFLYHLWKLAMPATIIRFAPRDYFAGGYADADIPATETASAAPSSALGQGCVHPDASVEQKVAILAIKGTRVEAHVQRRVDLSPLSFLDRQWTPLLDSIAELCIGKAQHEIVAIGLQASINEELVVISIATNNVVPTPTITH